MLCFITFFVTGLALLDTCKADTHMNVNAHRAHRLAHREAGLRIGGADPVDHARRDVVPDIDIVTETVYETTYVDYHEPTSTTTITTQLTSTSTVTPTLTTSSSSLSSTSSTSSTSSISSSSSSSSTSKVKVASNGEADGIKAKPHTKTKSSTKHTTASEKVVPTSIPLTSFVPTRAASPTTLIQSTRSVAPAADVAAPTTNPAYAAVISSAISAMGASFSTSSLQWTNVRGWIAANAYNDIMDVDYYAKSTTYQTTYGSALFNIATSPSDQGEVLSTDGYNDDQLWWCLAMLRAYQNYGHQELLNQTIKQWNAIGANAQVFTSDQGTTPNKGGLARSIRIPANCDVNGAVYWSSQSSSTLNAISTGLYAQVGAWLFELTGDSSFRGPADAALGWLQRVMLNGKTGVMDIDNLSVGNCQKNPGSLTYNTGVYIGALASLYRSTGETSYLTAATQSVTSAATGSFGNSPPLVIGEENSLTTDSDAVQWRDVLFRNIVDFYVSLVPKGAVDSTLQSQVQAFFKANYDQIQSKAKFGDLYAANWFGSIQGGSDWGTATVLSCLTGAMMIL